MAPRISLHHADAALGTEKVNRNGVRNPWPCVLFENNASTIGIIGRQIGLFIIGAGAFRHLVTEQNHDIVMYLSGYVLRAEISWLASKNGCSLAVSYVERGIVLKKFGMIIAGAVFLGALSYGSAYALSIGPDCGTCQGSIYSLSYDGTALPDSDPLHETYRITYDIDTTGYNGGGSYLDQVALKVSSSVYNVSLFGAPGGTGAWSLNPGGIDAGGCSGSGSGFSCADSTISLNSGLGVVVPGGTYSWIFDVAVANGTLFAGLDGSSIKARYVDRNGDKVGSLVSETLTKQVPEPSSFLLLGSGLLAFGLVTRRYGHATY